MEAFLEKIILDLGMPVFLRLTPPCLLPGSYALKCKTTAADTTGTDCATDVKFCMMKSVYADNTSEYI